MSVVIILVSASLIIALGFLAAFIWSVKDGQYEDDYTPSVRMLFEDGIGRTHPETVTKPGARDVKGLAPASAACLLRHEEAEAIAEPVAARPGAQKNK
jgi:cbb3-type cytochrome oxidase maturation protein